jgi:hypothetical protein
LKLKDLFLFQHDKLNYQLKGRKYKKVLETFGQFNQHFMSAVAPIFFCQKMFKPKICVQEKLCAKLLYKKAARKMLVKLTPSLNEHEASLEI